MRLNSVVRITNGSMGRDVAFGRAPKKGYEEQDFNRTLKVAFDYLGTENVSLIMHGVSFPEIQGQYNSKVGTPNGADELVEFTQLHGFNSHQLGPNGKLKYGDDDTSPYSSSVFEKNTLFINFNQLLSGDYASILDEKDLAKYLEKPKATSKNFTTANYKEAKKDTDALLDIAYKNFSSKLIAGNKDAIRLNDEFTAFQKQNSQWLDYYAVLSIITKKHNTDYYPNWPQEDQNLIYDVKQGDTVAKQRFERIIADNKEEIEKYKFAQFLVDKQTKADNIARGGYVYISDLEVGTSSLDELVFKDVFLPNYKIGCKYGGVKNSPQLWGISIPDPNKLFNEDGSLGPSGQFIKAKLQNALSGAQSIRIDHAMGLVNPYLYKPESVKYAVAFENGQKIKYPIREALHAGYLSELGIDKNNNYQKVLSKIVIPTMEEMGINPQDVIWEDLGNDETGIFDKIFRDELHLPGISCMIWEKGTDARQKRDNWAYVGCHDNKPGRQLVHDKETKKQEPWKSEYLVDALRCDPYKSAERSALERKITLSPKELWKAKLADLFYSTKNIQISFMDFFGINKSFNTPGTVGAENWSLRLNPNYKDTYYRALENNDWAINMPEILEMAVQAKFDEEVSKNHKPYWETKEQVDPILSRLNYWKNVLKVKESK